MVEVIEEYNTAEVMEYEEESEKSLLKNMLIELKQIRINQENQLSQQRESGDKNRRTKFIYCPVGQYSVLEDYLNSCAVAWVRFNSVNDNFYEYQIKADNDKFNQIAQDLMLKGIKAYASFDRAPFFLCSQPVGNVLPYWLASSGTEYGVYAFGNVMQSGTAGYALYYGDTLTTSSGSGTKYLILLRSEGNNRFYGDVSGNFYVSANVLCNSLMARENESTQNINSRSYSGSSGTKTASMFNITINQSGTAGYNGVVITITETSTGSGAKIPFEIRTGSSPARVFAVDNSGQINFVSGNQATGSGSASLGANCPASTLSAPNTWLKFRKSDGTQLFVPAWA